ncbi:MAG: hypothetical protein ABSE25_08720 [Syntrophorhabdales bacterium]|jgi:hypothetical protein
MRKAGCAVLLVSVLILAAGSMGYGQSAEDLINNPGLRPQSQAIKYVYRSGSTVFTMYIRGDDVTVTNNFSNLSDTRVIGSKWTEGGKLFLKTNGGEIFTIYGDTLFWGTAVYKRESD